jgi:uncharacterized protein
MRFQTFSAFLVLALLPSCADTRKTASHDDLYSRVVRMPDGTRYTAEAVSKPFDMSRGLMFRDSLPPDRGMLFIYGADGLYPAWTYQNRFPVDIIWLDLNRLVTEIVPNAEPCKSASASKCPSLGGTKRSLYVLELNAGLAAKHKLKPGDRIDF